MQYETHIQKKAMPLTSCRHHEPLMVNVIAHFTCSLYVYTSSIASGEYVCTSHSRQVLHVGPAHVQTWTVGWHCEQKGAQRLHGCSDSTCVV